MWPTKRIQQIAEDGAARIETSVGALAVGLAVLSVAVLATLACVVVLMARER